MAKLKKYWKWIIPVILVLLVFLWYFEWPQPMFEDPASVNIFNGESITYWNGIEPQTLYVGTDFALEDLQTILADCQVSRKIGGFPVVENRDNFEMYLVDGNDIVHSVYLGKNLHLSYSYGSLEIKNHDEIYSRLMDLFAGKLTV